MPTPKKNPVAAPDPEKVAELQALVLESVAQYGDLFDPDVQRAVARRFVLDLPLADLVDIVGDRCMVSGMRLSKASFLPVKPTNAKEHAAREVFEALVAAVRKRVFYAQPSTIERTVEMIGGLP